MHFINAQLNLNLLYYQSADPDDLAVDSFGRIIQPRGENSESRRGEDSRDEAHESSAAPSRRDESDGRLNGNEGKRENDRSHDRVRDGPNSRGPGHLNRDRGSSRDRDRDRGRGGYDRGRGGGPRHSGGPRDLAPTGARGMRPGSRFERSAPPPPYERDRERGGKDIELLII